MNVDSYGNISFSTQEVIESLYGMKDFTIPDIEDQQEHQRHKEFSHYFGIDQINSIIQPTSDPIDYHLMLASQWKMPDDYKNIDIKELLSNKLAEKNLVTDQYINVLIEELQEFEDRNMFNLLKFLKYLMDTCTKHDIVTGVGRGSSVASLVLYLLGVHAIDPIKYNLDYKEFLR